MSVQLIVYPQSNTEGVYEPTSTPLFPEHVSNYTFNNSAFGSSYNLTGTPAVDTVVANVTPTNTWKTWHSTGGTYGSISAPVISSGKITLDSHGSTASSTGILQLIDNLIVGGTYTLKIEILAGTTGLVVIGHHSSWGTISVPYTPILNTSITPSVGTQTLSFTATHASMVFILHYVNSDNSNLEIGKVSIKPTATTSPLVDEYRDGQQILDLYSETNIPLSLSIDNFKNVAEKSQSYSKGFKLPATKKNNKIFNSIFDITKSIQGDQFAFNPYRKTRAILKEDSYIIFEGYLRLIDIDENNEEISYNVNLYTDTVSLADTLKEKKFKDIDFSELYHSYNKTNIKNSWESDTGITLTNAITTDSFAYGGASLGTSKTNVVKYPFVKWNGDSYFDPDDADVKLTTLEDAFRPWLRCKYLVDRIITEAGFTYNSDFLESSDFTRLFMDFNWGSETIIDSGITHSDTKKFVDEQVIGTSYTVIQADLWQSNNYSNNASTLSEFNNSTHIYTATQQNQLFVFSGQVPIKNHDSSSRTVTVRLHHKNSAGTTLNIINLMTSSGTTISIGAGGMRYFYAPYLEIHCSLNDTIQLEGISSAGSLVKVDSSVGIGDYMHVKINQTDTISNHHFHSLRGELGQWDFIKGIMNMFNLVILKDKTDPFTLIIEPYRAVFIDDSESQYITHSTTKIDWTNKVDISSIKQKPMQLKKMVKLNYVEEKEDYPKNVYSQATGHEYGKYEIDASDFDLLSGEEKIQATPFAATFVKPIFETFDPEMVIPVIYQEDNEGFKGYKNKPRILYDVSHNTKKTLTGGTYYIPPQNGLSSENQSSFGQFSHLTEVPTTTSTKDYNYSTQQIVTQVGAFIPVDNLFNTYWSPYYDELYNSDTRVVTMKVNLSPSDISNFNFYDTVFIKNREYRVNKIDYKPYELSTVEFILIP
ncbi:MAG: hypothetical protein GOVbin3264_9 [Prokaryotic dsDNA virus sp.]|nr:MAG: hypothetical protein GOVbin3264_9 [Prokaryotic dsDNA virus sp.]